MAPYTSARKYLYSQATAKSLPPIREACKYNTFVQARNKSQGVQYIIAEINAKMNPAEIKVDVSAFKNLRNGKIAIISTSQEEIELIATK